MAPPPPGQPMAPPPLPAPPPTLAASIAAATPTVPPTDEGHDGSAVPDEAPDPLLLVAHTHRSVYAADQQNDIWFALSVKATGLDTGTRQGLDLVVMMDTSESMKAGGWLAACSASLQYLLRHHLDARDRVCLVHFDATTQTTLHHPFMPATGGGQQQLEALLHANMASTSNAARMGFSEALLKCFGMLKQRPSSRSSPSPSRCPCILILTDSDSLCADSLVLTRILEREAPRLPGLNVTAVGLGDRHDAGLLHVLGDLRSVCSEGNRNGRGSYFYAGCPKGAVVAITEGVGQWLAPVVAREAVLTVHADIYHNPDDGTAAAAAAGTAGAVWLQGMFEDEEGESDAKAWLPGEMQDVPGFFEKVLIKNRRVLRLDLGSLPNGSVQRVMIKTRLPVVRGAGASKELLTRQKVAFCKLRYWDVTGGGGSSSILREQTLQVKVLRSRHRRAESI